MYKQINFRQKTQLNKTVSFIVKFINTSLKEIRKRREYKMESRYVEA